MSKGDNSNNKQAMQESLLLLIGTLRCLWLKSLKVIGHTLQRWGCRGNDDGEGLGTCGAPALAAMRPCPCTGVRVQTDTNPLIFNHALRNVCLIL